LETENCAYKGERGTWKKEGVGGEKKKSASISGRRYLDRVGRARTGKNERRK